MFLYIIDERNEDFIKSGKIKKYFRKGFFGNGFGYPLSWYITQENIFHTDIIFTTPYPQNFNQYAFYNISILNTDEKKIIFSNNLENYEKYNLEENENDSSLWIFIDFNQYEVSLELHNINCYLKIKESCDSIEDEEGLENFNKVLKDKYFKEMIYWNIYFFEDDYNFKIEPNLDKLGHIYDENIIKSLEKEITNYLEERDINVISMYYSLVDNLGNYYIVSVNSYEDGLIDFSFEKNVINDEQQFDAYILQNQIHKNISPINSYNMTFDGNVYC